MGQRELLIEILGRRCSECGNTDMADIGIFPKSGDRELIFNDEFYDFYLNNRYEATQTLVAKCSNCTSKPFSGLTKTDAKIIKK